MNPFNSPIEVAVRTLTVLTEAHPSALDLGQLVLLDHLVLNSGDVGGPESLHPPLPTRVGQLSIKRTSIEAGIRVLLNAGLVEVTADDGGLTYAAAEMSGPFLGVLGSEYFRRLTERSEWVVSEFGELEQGELRAQMRGAFDAWVEEFEHDTETHQ